jgi:hypothetical protein
MASKDRRSNPVSPDEKMNGDFNQERRREHVPSYFGWSGMPMQPPFVDQLEMERMQNHPAAEALWNQAQSSSQAFHAHQHAMHSMAMMHGMAMAGMTMMPGMIPPSIIPPGMIPPGMIPPGMIPPGMIPPGIPQGMIPRGIMPVIPYPPMMDPSQMYPQPPEPKDNTHDKESKPQDDEVSEERRLRVTRAYVFYKARG